MGTGASAAASEALNAASTEDLAASLVQLSDEDRNKIMEALKGAPADTAAGDAAADDAAACGVAAGVAAACGIAACGVAAGVAAAGDAAADGAAAGDAAADDAAADGAAAGDAAAADAPADDAAADDAAAGGPAAGVAAACGIAACGIAAGVAAAGDAAADGAPADDAAAADAAADDAAADDAAAGGVAAGVAAADDAAADGAAAGDAAAGGAEADDAAADDAAAGGAAAGVAAAADAAADDSAAGGAAAGDAAVADAAAGEAAAGDTAAGDAAASVAAAPQLEKKASAVDFFAEYFDMAQARTEALISDQAKLIGIITNPEKAKEFQEECKAWFASAATPLLEQAFKVYDSKGTGVLDKEETAAFLADLVDENTQISKAMSSSAGAAAVRGQLRVDNPGASDEQLEDRVRKAVEERNADIQKKQDAYMGDKAARDVAAFKVLDMNGDGTLDLQEFLAIFEPENKQNNALYLALGFLTEEEIAACNA